MKVMFNDNEAAVLLNVYARNGDRGGVMGVATAAVELVAARDGTMTAEGVMDALSELRETVELLGSKDVRETDRLRLWQVGHHITAHGARLAVAEADLERVALERDMARQLHGALILEASAQVSALEKEIAALKAAGAVLSAHVDKTAGVPLSSVEGFDEGAEAMRAACWEAVQALLQSYGMQGSNWANALRDAIEGAAP